MSEPTIDNIRERLARELDTIANRREWSPHARQVAAAAAWARAQDAAQTLAQNSVKTVANRRLALERKIFGNTSNSDAQTAMSRRDAQDRAEQIDNPAEALRLLQRAERAGDELLCQAIASRAGDFAATQVDANTPGGKSWSTVLDAYAQTRPDVAEALQEMTALPTIDRPSRTLRSLGDQLRHSGEYLVPTPTQLTGMDEHRIRALAATEHEVFDTDTNDAA